MTTQAEAAKPATAKRALFKRPKWAASNTKALAETSSQQTTEIKTESDEFFSRSNETFAAFAAKEEEREHRRKQRRAAQQSTKSPTPAGDPKSSSKPSPKRRRISTENDDEDDGPHLSDFEAERMEEEAAAAKAAVAVEKTEFSQLLEKGKALVQDGMTKLGMDTEPTPPSPSKLPSYVPRIPNDEQCEQIRQRNPKLAGCDNSTIRLLALRKWERNHQEKIHSPPPASPSWQLRSSGRQDQSLTSKEMALRTSPFEANAQNPTSATTIVLVVEDDEEATPAATSHVPAAVPSSEHADAEQSLNLQELERHARQIARRKLLMEKPVHSSSPGLPGTSAPPALQRDTKGQNPASTPKSQPEPEPDAEVSILISSSIPDTRPLIVKRKISQRLKEVREYWCNTNNLSSEVKSKVQLHFRKRRLYDSHTCKALGFIVGPDGKVMLKAAADDIFDDYDGRIHLVAVAEGLSQDTATNGAGGISFQATKDNQDPEVEIQRKREEEYRITIRAPGYPPCKIIVKPSTMIQRIIDAFRKNGKVPQSKNVALQFDGDLLQPNSTVAHTDIGDMEFIDAYVR